MAVVDDNERVRPAVKQTCIQYRYVVTTLTFFGITTMQAMRTVLGVTIVVMVSKNATRHEAASNETCPLPEYDSNITITHENDNHTGFDWDEKTQALILGSYSYGLMVSQIMGGYICDLLGAKTVFGVGIFVSSLMTLLSPIAARQSYIALTIVRVILGLSQGPLIPCMSCIVGRWIPKHERTFLHGIMRAGANTGAIIGSLGSGFLSASSILGGWPLAYYTYGCGGLVWCLFWYFLMYEYPRDHLYISPKEMNYILTHMLAEGHFQKTSKYIPWKSMLTSFPIWMCAVCFFGASWSVTMLMNNLATYMKFILHYNIEANGLLSSLHYFLAIVVVVLSGRIADWVFQKGYMNDTNLRKVYIGVGNVLGPLLLVAVTVVGCKRDVIVGFISVGGSLVALSVPGIEIAIINMSPTYAGTITGLCAGFGEISGVVSSEVVGTLTQHNETIRQWKKVFYVSAAVIFGTSLPFLICGSAELQEWSVNKRDEDDSATNRVETAIENGVVCSTAPHELPVVSPQGS